MKKNYLFILLVLLCCVCMSVAHADGVCGANLTWTLENGTLTISGTGDMEDWFISTPWYNEKDNIQNVVIEEGCTSIGDFAFYQCGKMRSIIIPEGVTRIGDNAFDWCRELTSITIPDSVMSIGDDAFGVCSKLTNIVVPANVTTIGETAFGQCESLVMIELPEGLTSIGRSAFYSCGKLTSITLPSTLTYIGDTVFKSCGSLTAIDVAEGSASYIAVDGVLYSKDKTSLIAYPADKAKTSYSVPDGVTSLGNASFYGAKKLTEIILPVGLKTLGEDCFMNCQKLQRINIPEGVTTIGDTAFVHCYELAGISFPSTLENIGDDIFESCHKMMYIDVALDNQYFSSVDGVLFNADKTHLLYYALGKQTPIYDVPYGVTTIGQYAFLYSKYLKQVTFPEGLTTIEDSAFSGVDLVTLSFPSTLITIDSHAFSSNGGLTQVTIPANILTLGYGAFSWCNKLISVTVGGMYTDFDEWGVFDFGNDNLIIYGLEGSTAQAHALEEEITFKVVTPTPASTEAPSADGWICPSCNTNMTGGKFCWECGTAKPEPPKPQTCAGCGYVVPENMKMKFCPECGMKLEMLKNSLNISNIDKLLNASVGDYITFGSYEQDNNLANGKEPIEWMVLAHENNRLLVISRYVLERRRYNEKEKDAIWETCELRKWLNNEFVTNAFSAAEQAIIPIVKVTADKNLEYGTNPGSDTQDKVFLLSSKEVKQYFASNSSMKCKATEYAEGDFLRWWLRTPGINQSNASTVYEFGGIYNFGLYAFADYGGVRPAMWIELDQ